MGGRAIITALIYAAPLTAGAAVLPISGSYGNDLGCELARTGNYNPVDGVYLLTPQELATSVTSCSFDEVTSTADRHRVSMTCASEGSGPEDNTTEKAEIAGSAAAGYTVRFPDGTEWGPLKRC
jgi:hypothetical protein